MAFRSRARLYLAAGLLAAFLQDPDTLRIHAAAALPHLAAER